MSIDKFLENRVGVITLISLVFEIVKMIWTFFMASSWGENSLLYTIYIIGLLVIDYMVIKSLTYYLMGLIKNNMSYMRKFNYGLDGWIICLLISGFSTVVLYTHIQIENRHCNNYLISRDFSKRIPFYLSIICNIISGLYFYFNAKKYNGCSSSSSSSDEWAFQSKFQPQPPSQPQLKTQSELISSIISQTEIFSSLISQLKNNIQS